MTLRLLTSLVLTAGALLLSGCGGGGNEGPATASLEVIKAGNGTGTVSGSGINCGTTCSVATTVGTALSLTAAPASGQRFDGWSGDAANCGSNTNCNFTVTTSRFVATASFSVLPSTTLTVAVSGSSAGTVTSNPAGINCSNAAGSDCSETYSQGSTVTLTATPASNSRFTRWTGAAASCASNPCSLTLTGNAFNVGAVFDASSRVLTISKTGNGLGTVSSMPVGINCGSSCSANFVSGGLVTLSAVASGTDNFQGWSGGGCSGNGSCAVTLNADTTITASFTASTTLGDVFGLTSANHVVSFDRATPGTFRTNAVVTGLTAGETVLAIDTRPLDNKLYGLTSARRLVTIDPVTGAATLKSTLVADSSDTTAPFNSTTGISGNPGMDFNPVVDRLRIVTSTGQNLRVNADTGTVITDAALNPGAPAVSDAAYTFNFSGSTGTTLFVIDSASDKLQVQTVNPGQANDGTLVDIGALGVDVAVDGGFEIIGSNVDSFAALKASADPAAGAFYRIDLRTGAATKVGNFTGTEAIIGLTAPIPAAPPAAGDLALLSASGKLITVNRSASTTVRTSNFVTGIPAAETLMDIDYRPQTGDGELLLLSRDSGGTGRLYLVSAATGAATLRSTIGGATPVVLTGDHIGIDINPALDRLRVITSSGQNLNVNIADGVTATEATINPAGAVIVAAAYTNAFVNTASTTLYTLDSNTRMLNRQDPASDGTQAAVGSLGLTTVTAPLGFDINAVNNEGLLSMTEGGTAKLFSVNLVSGAATGSTALPAGETYRGISLRTQKEPQVIAEVTGITGSTNACTTTARCLISFTHSNPNNYTILKSGFTLGTGVTLLGMDFRPQNGDLVALGLDASEAKLYSISLGGAGAPAAGTVTELSTLSPDVSDTADGNAPYTSALLPAAATNFYAVDFNPVVDRLRIVGSNNVNLRVNVETGATFTDTTVGRPSFAIAGTAFNSDSMLYGLDSANDRLFTIANPNTGGTPGRLTQVGPLGVDVGEVNGFDIIGSSEAYFVGTDAADNAVKLYALTLSTGAATLRGMVGTTGQLTNIVALAASTAGSNDLFGLTSSNQIFSFNRTTPSPLITNPQATTGFGTGETVVGMDFRAAGTTPNTLFVVTRVNATGVGKVYTLDVQTRMATVSPAGNMTMQGDDFVLTGTQFGVDINPATGGALRVTSNTGLNVDVDLTTLMVTNRTAINQTPVPAIGSAAYTNSYAGALTTQLFALDGANDSLMRQGKVTPNDGQLFDIKPLSFNIASNGGFDCLGGDNGYCVGVLKLDANAYSTLYRVNLAGAAAGLTFSGANQVASDVGRNPTNVETRVLVNAATVRFTP